MPLVNFFCQFLTIFNKNHTLVKEVQLKSTRGQLLDFFIGTLSLFTHKKNENRFLPKIYNWHCWHLFTIRNSHGIPSTIFISIIRVLWSLLQDLHRLSFLTVWYWNLTSKRGCFIEEILGFFFTLLNEHRLNSEVFMNIK